MFITLKKLLLLLLVLVRLERKDEDIRVQITWYIMGSSRNWIGCLKILKFDNLLVL